VGRGVIYCNDNRLKSPKECGEIIAKAILSDLDKYRFNVKHPNLYIVRMYQFRKLMRQYCPCEYLYKPPITGQVKAWVVNWFFTWGIEVKVIKQNGHRCRDCNVILFKLPETIKTPTHTPTLG